MPKREFPNWFIEEIYNEDEKQLALRGLLKSTDKVTFKCPIHGPYEQLVNTHIKISTMERKSGCRLCGFQSLYKSKAKIYKYPDWFINDLYLEEDKQRARDGTVRAVEKIQFYCNQHGVYSQIVKDHIDMRTMKPKQSCPVCGRIKQIKSYRLHKLQSRIYPDWFIEELYLQEDKDRALRGSIATTEHLQFLCPVHGPYSQLVSNHLRLTDNLKVSGCPKCVQGQKHSRFEDLVLKTINPNITYELNARGYLPNNYEADIVFPSRNILIECNGSYWHRTLTQFNKSDPNARPSTYHHDKFLLAKKLGYHLINLFDVDFQKPSVVRYLQNLLTPKQLIYARQCTLKQIPIQEARSFCSLYHIQGSETYSTVAYALYYNDSIISLMTFGRKRFQSDPLIWELCRYCVKEGYTVIGGSQKLLSYFENNHKIKQLISYSDNDFFLGSIYESLGFTYKDCNINYYWYHQHKEIKREQAQLKLLASRYPDLYNKSLSIEGNKEDFIMTSLGAFKVYRSGNSKWVKYYK